MTEGSSQSASASYALQPGSKFHGYTVVRCVGVGGMGAVFEGVHDMLGRRCAIKVLHAKAAERAESRERFVREARSVAKIKHPNVVEIFDVGLLGEAPYLVMEFLEGESLENALTRLGPMDAQGTTTVLLPIAAAIGAVHRAGIVHRDIKPDNVFLARDPKGHVVPKLVDFGIAKDLGAPMRGSHHTVVGTPHYMSPEQARGSLTMDARTDEYAFGVMLYQLSTGHLPYDAESLLDLMRAIDSGRATPPRRWNPELPVEFESVILRAMAHDANDRFPSMVEVGRALMPFASPRLRSLYASDFGTSAAVYGDPSTASAELDAVAAHSTSARTESATSTTTTLDEMVGRRSSSGRAADATGRIATDDSAGVARVTSRTTTGSVAARRARRNGLVAVLGAMLLVVLGVGAYLLAAPTEQPVLLAPPPVPVATPSVAAPPPTPPAEVAVGAAPSAPVIPSDEAPSSPDEPTIRPRNSSMRNGTRPSAPASTPEPSLGIRLAR